jgi:hypothetical protein
MIKVEEPLPLPGESPWIILLVDQWPATARNYTTEALPQAAEAVLEPSPQEYRP